MNNHGATTNYLLEYEGNIESRKCEQDKRERARLRRRRFFSNPVKFLLQPGRTGVGSLLASGVSSVWVGASTVDTHHVLGVLEIRIMLSLAGLAVRWTWISSNIKCLSHTASVMDDRHLLLEFRSLHPSDNFRKDSSFRGHGCFPPLSLVRSFTSNLSVISVAAFLGYRLASGTSLLLIAVTCLAKSPGKTQCCTVPSRVVPSHLVPGWISSARGSVGKI